MPKTPQKGFVYLIGAGPGDVGLITVKALDTLNRCNVVLYDALVNPLLLSSLPVTIQRIYVGKRGGSSSTHQKNINALLVRLARHGKIIGRLKGGDPLLLGRGSEEMEYLRKYHIPYEVIPGISSALAGPLMAGIPVTHRSVSHSLAIVTGHLQQGQSTDNLHLPEADTLVFLMAIENLTILIEKLIHEKHYSPQTPAALVSNATLPNQKSVVGTLKTIETLKNRHTISAPAVFIIGKTVRLSKTLQWFPKPRLVGIRIIVPHLTNQQPRFLNELSAQGATVIPWSLRIPDQKISFRKQLSQNSFTRFTMLFCTSLYSTQTIFTYLKNSAFDLRQLFGKKIIALTHSISHVLSEYGICADGIVTKNSTDRNKALDTHSTHQILVSDPLKNHDHSINELIVKPHVKATYCSLTYPDLDPRVYDTIQDQDIVLLTDPLIAELFYTSYTKDRSTVVPCCIGTDTIETVAVYSQQKKRSKPDKKMVSAIKTLTNTILHTQDE